MKLQKRLSDYKYVVSIKSQKQLSNHEHIVKNHKNDYIIINTLLTLLNIKKIVQKRYINFMKHQI